MMDPSSAGEAGDWQCRQFSQERAVSYKKTAGDAGV
jgi:hypothetical protein